MKYLNIFVVIAFLACTDEKPAEGTAAAGKGVADSLLRRPQIEVDTPSHVKAHPAARDLLKDDWLYNLDDDHAPFGNRYGAFAYVMFVQWRKTNPDAGTKGFLLRHLENWEYAPFDLNATDYNSLRNFLEGNKLGWGHLFRTDAAIIATAFGQLYREGRIDVDMKQMAMTAIERESTHEIIQSWEEHRPEREEKLKRLQKILAEAGS